MISSETGDYPRECPFLYSSDDSWLCSIYETRPSVCREYHPGSSELCPQWKGRAVSKEIATTPRRFAMTYDLIIISPNRSYSSAEVILHFTILPIWTLDFLM